MKTLGMFKVDATMIVLNDRVLQHGSHVL